MDKYRELDRYITLKLTTLGLDSPQATTDPAFLRIAGPLLRNFHQKDQLLAHRLSPVDSRIQAYLDSRLACVCPDGVPRLPCRTFAIDVPGLARELSFAPGSERFSSPYVESYRVAQGVLHNPRSDRRTTQGVFHIAEGGLPIPADKTAAPLSVFARLLAAALAPPEDVLVLPYTSSESKPVGLFVSLLLRPLVAPATANSAEKTMETRFFAPGSLVSNLDFVETIFGNGGDPYLPENDAALDPVHWTGHTGCVILAPHLPQLRKRDLGLPHISDATDRQKRDGMCWQDEDELYNEGNAFKITSRDASGVTVTVIADNYFGYCKKEVKTQISFAANLYGLAEEEHAGGAIAFATYVLGEDFMAERVHVKSATLEHALRLLGGSAEVRPEGYAVDRRFPSILYLPEEAEFNVRAGWIRWISDGQARQIPLRAGEIYMLPSGYRVRLEKQVAGAAWRLVGTRPAGTFCHKPCTVSGGGKSEISKSISDVLLKGPIFVRDLHKDMDEVADVLSRDYSRIYRRRPPDARNRRTILSMERSLGSVIQLLTPSTDYTDEHNQWLRELPPTIRQLVCTVKRYYRPAWGDQWRSHFGVDRINGNLGHELKFEGEKLVSNYLRVGYDPDGSWRIYKLRPDFHPADKVQFEDDISVSIVVPRPSLAHLDPAYSHPSVKLISNCENVLFQRPDDAIVRGADRQAEADLAAPGNFLSNFEPISRAHAQAIVDHTAEFDRYTEPMKRRLLHFLASDASFAASSAHPRMVDGKPSKNPRYLQPRPDRVNAREAWVAETGARLARNVPDGERVYFPVNAVLPGRRNNPPDAKAGIAPLAVYNPIHYQELPELFMEFVSSLTGKSPSTTGFGSEGALTKGPFNALWPVVDLNNALVSMIVTGYAGYTTSAGFIGPKYRVDHDISMLVPEIWCRMRVEEKDPEFLIRGGYLEKVGDLIYDGKTVLASRLGYRITREFTERFLGRIFETPNKVLGEELLRPERQDLALFVEGVNAIVESQSRVACTYFEDGSIEAACPPLRILLHVMAHGTYEGMGIEDPMLRAQFTREAVISSDWYAERLKHRQKKETALWERHLKALDSFQASGMEIPSDLDFQGRRGAALAALEWVRSPEYLPSLVGTIGADPFA